MLMVSLIVRDVLGRQPERSEELIRFWLGILWCPFGFDVLEKFFELLLHRRHVVAQVEVVCEVRGRAKNFRATESFFSY